MSIDSIPRLFQFQSTKFNLPVFTLIKFYVDFVSTFSITSGIYFKMRHFIIFVFVTIWNMIIGMAKCKNERTKNCIEMMIYLSHIRLYYNWIRKILLRYDEVAQINLYFKLPSCDGGSVMTKRYNCIGFCCCCVSFWFSFHALQIVFIESTEMLSKMEFFFFRWKKKSRRREKKDYLPK